MKGARIELFEPVDLDGALVVVAFHGIGAAAPIAASYLHNQLSLPLVGEVRVPGLGPVVQVTQGRATGPVRIFGGEAACNLGDGCPRIYVVVSELPLPQTHIEEISTALLAWAKGAKLILALDAIARGDTDDEPAVFAVADSAAALKQLDASKTEPLSTGVLVGAPAALMLHARDLQVAVATLVVEAAKNHPDGRAAAALIAAMDPLIPEIKMDTLPLIEEAMEIEAKLAASIEEVEEANARRPSHTFI